MFKWVSVHEPVHLSFVADQQQFSCMAGLAGPIFQPGVVSSQGKPCCGIQYAYKQPSTQAIYTATLAP